MKKLHLLNIRLLLLSLIFVSIFISSISFAGIITNDPPEMNHYWAEFLPQECRYPQEEMVAFNYRDVEHLVLPQGCKMRLIQSKDADWRTSSFDMRVSRSVVAINQDFSKSSPDIFSNSTLAQYAGRDILVLVRYQDSSSNQPFDKSIRPVNIVNFLPESSSRITAVILTVLENIYVDNLGVHFNALDYVYYLQ